MKDKGPVFGNGRMDAVQVVGPLTLADTTMPTLFLQWNPGAVPGDLQTVQRKGATVTIAPTGAAGSKVLITLTVSRNNFLGEALADLTYTISGAAAKVAWSSSAASAATLQDVVDLIKELDGFNAWVGHAPATMSVNSDNFVALSATAIGTGTGVSDYTQVLYRDVSEFTDANSDYVAWMRIGLPELRDRNALRLLEIEGSCTGATNGVLKLYNNDGEVYVNKTLAEAQTSYVGDKIDDAVTIRGPVLLEVRSDDLTVAEYRVRIMQASIGG